MTAKASLLTGTAGTAVSTTNAGGPDNLTSVTNSTATTLAFSNTILHPDASNLVKISPGGTTQTFLTVSGFASTVSLWARVVFAIGSTPTANLPIIRCANATNVAHARLVCGTAMKLITQKGSGNVNGITFTTTLVANTIYQITVQFIAGVAGNGTVWTLLDVNGNVLETQTDAAFSGQTTLDRIDLGMSGSAPNSGMTLYVGRLSIDTAAAVPKYSWAQSVTMAGVATAESVSTFTTTQSGLSATMAGVATAEAFGAFSRNAVISATMAALSTSETFGLFSVTPGAISATMVAIASAEALGTWDATLISSAVRSASLIGTNGTSLTTANSGGPDQFDAVNTTPTFTTATTFLDGSGVVAITPGVGAQQSASWIGFGGTTLGARIVFKLGSLPGANFPIMRFRNSLNGSHSRAIITAAGLLFNQHGSANSAGQTGSVTLDPANWYQLVGLATGGATGTVDFWLYDASGNLLDHIQDTAFTIARTEVDGVDLGFAGSNATSSSTVYIGRAAASPLGAPATYSWSQSVTMAGVATAQALGNISATPGATSTTMVAITSAEALGNFTPQAGAVSITMVGVSSAGALGLFSVTAGAVSITMTGVASAEAFGNISSTTGAVSITMIGVTSAGALGVFTPQPGAVSLTMVGIATAEALGLPSATIGAINVTMVGINSAEALGNFSTTAGAVSLTMVGVASAEALGLFSVTAGAVSFTMVGVPSSETFGLPSISAGSLTATMVGVASDETFGVPSVTVGGVTATLTAISSSEGFGTWTASTGGLTVTLVGISTAEALGTPAIAPGAVSTTLVGLASAEAVTPFSVLASILANMVSIGSAESVSPITASSIIAASIPSITSLEALGLISTILGGVSITMIGVASDGALGTPDVTIGALLASIPGIPSEEAVSSFSVTPGGVSQTLQAIASAEAFGTLTALAVISTDLTSISSAEVVNPIAGFVYTQIIIPSPIPSAENFGLLDLDIASTKFFQGVPSAAAVGTPNIYLLAIIGYYGGRAIVVLANGQASMVDSRGRVIVLSPSTKYVVEEIDYGKTVVGGGTSKSETVSESGSLRVF